MHLLNLSAIVIGGLVRLIKSDKLDAVLATYGIPMIPPKALPWISLALGVAAGAIAAAMGGLGWSQALQEGLVSGCLSIAGHELVIESMRNGKEMPPRPETPNDLTVIH